MKITPNDASAAIPYLAMVTAWKLKFLRLYLDTAVFAHRNTPANKPNNPANGVISPVAKLGTISLNVMRYAPIIAMIASQINCFVISSLSTSLAAMTHRIGCNC